MATVTKPDPNGRYICAIAHCGPAGDSRFEEVVAGNDPRLLAAPHLFVEASTPSSEWPTPFDSAVETNERNARDLEEARVAAFERAAKANKVKVQARLFKVTQDTQTTYGGAPSIVAKGSLLAETDPFVTEHPDAVEPVK